MKILGVISYYNHRDYIEQAIRSLIDQNLPVDILVMNDDPDMHFDAMAKDLNFIFKYDGLNKGQSARFNEAISWAAIHNYDWLMFQGSDDYSLPFRSLLVNKIALQAPSVDMFYTDFISVYKENEYVYQASRGFDNFALIEHNYIAASTVNIKVKAALKVKFNEALSYGEDWLWYHKLYDKNTMIAYLPMPTVYYRETTSVIKDKSAKEKLKVKELIKELYDEESIDNWLSGFRSESTGETFN